MNKEVTTQVDERGDGTEGTAGHPELGCLAWVSLGKIWQD